MTIDGFELNNSSLVKEDTYQTNFGEVIIKNISTGTKGYVLCEYTPELSRTFIWSVKYSSDPNYRESSICMWH